MIHKKKILSLVFLFILILQFDFLSAADEQKTDLPTSPLEAVPQAFPFVGKVLKNNVNIRSGASTNYEVLGQANKDQEIVVWQEAFGWYAITPPEGIFFWVNSKYVNEGKVIADSVNVRVRSNTDCEVISQLERGDFIEVVSQNGEWLQIKPPQKSHAWIDKNFVAYSKSYNIYAATSDESTENKLDEARKQKLFEEAKKYETDEFFKPVDKIEIDAVLKKYEDLLKEYSNDSEFCKKVKVEIENVQKKQKWIPEETLVVVEETKSISSENLLQTIFEGRLEIADGLVKKSRRYKLIHGKVRTCILLGNPYELDRFLHQKVKVSGKITSYVYRTVPVVRVEKVERLTL
ncbi:MAG: hypothetical protein HYS07_08295 [Chlamydiae bacterium]|nr:hypothetical protein [Chlamydiota bacterium]MBI3276605.1 hypothetical protein [Chlamydiota bacterium]